MKWTFLFFENLRIFENNTHIKIVSFIITLNLKQVHFQVSYSSFSFISPVPLVLLRPFMFCLLELFWFHSSLLRFCIFHLFSLSETTLYLIIWTVSFNLFYHLFCTDFNSYLVSFSFLNFCIYKHFFPFRENGKCIKDLV